jgi:Tfp pilus assembly PilM family ATPase/Tfp pilus assembly protein PilN
MPRKCIGIDIGRTHVRAAQMARTSEGLRLERTFTTQTRRSTDSPTTILHSLFHEHGFDPRADVAVSLPHHMFFFADVQTDAAGLAGLQTGDASSLRNCFPIPTEDAISQVCSTLPSADRRNSLLVAATSRDQLAEHLALLDEAKIKPVRIDAPMIAAQAAIAVNHPDALKGLAVILYVDESTLSIAVTQDANLLQVRNLPMFSGEAQEAESLAQQTAEVVAQEIEITWKRLFGKDPEPGLGVLLIASGRMAELLVPAIREKIDSRIVPVNPCAATAKSETADADSSLCVAEGLALRTLQPQAAGRTDFLAAYRTRTRPVVRMRRELTICGGLAAAAAAVWVVGLFLQLSSLESRYAGLKEQEKAIFHHAVPEEPTIVNPAAQLQQKIDALRKDCETFTCFNPNQPGPLEVLSLLSRQIPASGNLRLCEMLIAGGSIRITGTCDSFATFGDWQRVLENTPGLRLVDAPQPQKNPDSQKVEFKVSLSTTEKKAS